MQHWLSFSSFFGHTPSRWSGGSWSQLHDWTHILADLTMFLGLILSSLFLRHLCSKKKESSLRQFALLASLFLFTYGGVYLLLFIATLSPSHILSTSLRIVALSLSFLAILTLFFRTKALFPLHSTESPVPKKGRHQATQPKRQGQQHNEHHFQSLVQSITDYAIYSLDNNGLFTSWNRGAEQLHGYPTSEALHQPLRMLFAPGNPQQKTSEQAMQHARTHGRFQSETTLLHKTGDPFFANITLTALRDKQGNPLGFSLIARDDTLLRQMQERMHNEKQKLELLQQQSNDKTTQEATPQQRQAIIEAIPDFVFRIDTNQHISDAKEDQRHPLAYLFYSVHNSLEGVPLERLPLPEELRQQFREKLQLAAHTKTLQTLEYKLHIPLRLSQSQKELYRSSDRLRFLANERHFETRIIQSGPAHQVCITRDITEQIQLLEELERSNKELESFAYAVSHDLKAPLRAIENLALWIQEDLPHEPPPEVQKHFERLHGRVLRMRQLLEGILEYSRAGHLSEAMEILDVRELLQEVLQLFEDPDNIQLELPQNLPVFPTIRAPLQQVFLNLISNAVRHNPSQHPIQILVQNQALFYEFGVRDQGPGIDPDYHDRIFHIFQTLKSRDKGGGAGVGLAIVKKIVETIGGRVSIESIPGQGSTFFFTWPKNLSHSSNTKYR